MFIIFCLCDGRDQIQNMYSKYFHQIFVIKLYQNFIQNCLFMNFSSFCTHIKFLLNYQKISLSISVPQSIDHPEDSRLVQQQRDTDDLYSTRTTRTMFDSQRDTEDVRQPTVHGGRLVRPLDQPTESSEDQETRTPSTN